MEIRYLAASVLAGVLCILYFGTIREGMPGSGIYVKILLRSGIMVCVLNVIAGSVMEICAGLREAYIPVLAIWGMAAVADLVLESLPCAFYREYEICFFSVNIVFATMTFLETFHLLSDPSGRSAVMPVIGMFLFLVPVAGGMIVMFGEADRVKGKNRERITEVGCICTLPASGWMLFDFLYSCWQVIKLMA